MATTLGFLETAQSNQRLLVSSNGAGRFNGWESLLQIDASRFTGGNTYWFVVTGIIGNFGPSNPFNLPHAAQVSLRFGGGTYIAGLEHSVDFQDTRFHGSEFGQPFMLIHSWTMPPTPVDVHVIGRVWLGPSGGPAPGAFEVDNLAAMVWDQTTLQANTGNGVDMFAASSSTAVSFLPPTAGPIHPLAVSVTPTGGAGTWLVYWASQILPGSEQFPSELGLDASEFLRPARLVRRGRYEIPPGGASNLIARQWTGQFKLIAEPATISHRIYGTDRHDQSTGQSQWHRGAILGIRMDSALEYFQEPVPGGGSKLVAGFWDLPPGGKVSRRHELSGAVDYVLLSQVDTRQNEAWVTRQEFDGAYITPRPMAVYCKTALEIIPQHRASKIVSAGGNHMFRHYGYLRAGGTWPQGIPQPNEGEDPYLIGFIPALDAILTGNVLETVGIFTEATIGKETSVALSSLPLLPVAPFRPLPATLHSEDREFLADLGYTVRHPKHSKTRRVYAIQWSAITEAEFSTLRTFLENLHTSGGAFRWKPPGDGAEGAWAIVEDSFQGSTEGDGVFTASLRAIELVYVVP